tara:strand:- start:10554 stop:11339 length:786 start_codon:yes stop_codon:yes gene_type:complete
MPKCINKVIVFDLDDTMGHFEELSIFLGGLKHLINKKITDKYIFKLLDIWPEFIRYGLIDILENLKKYKKRYNYVKVVIYTNNMGPRSWTMLIKQYLEKKINYKLFDKVITAYRKVEKTNKRTTHNKTYVDLLRATKYSKESEFIFLDDQYHAEMIHEKIKYIHLNPYDYGIPFHKMIEEYLHSPHGKVVKKKNWDNFRKKMLQYLSSGEGIYKYNIRRNQINKKDKEEYKIINKSIRDLVNINKTKNNRVYHNNRTRKNY